LELEPSLVLAPGPRDATCPDAPVRCAAERWKSGFKHPITWHQRHHTENRPYSVPRVPAAVSEWGTDLHHDKPLSSLPFSRSVPLFPMFPPKLRYHGVSIWQGGRLYQHAYFNLRTPPQMKGNKGNRGTAKEKGLKMRHFTADRVFPDIQRLGEQGNSSGKKANVATHYLAAGAPCRRWWGLQLETSDYCGPVRDGGDERMWIA
jgi:hypothetical protein